jgi:glycosyltransferase involved in cell wall biosynthesis
VDENRIRVIHNGVDLATFAEAPRYPHPRPYVLGLGNLLPRKGFDVLIRAYARLENPRADLILAGSGPERSNLAALAGQVGVAGRVKFAGRVEGEEKVSLYRSAEFFVCPSRREPFANVLLEALASGLPIVASAVGGNGELVFDGEHGLLVPPEDDAALATAMGRLLDGKGLSARFRAAAARFVRDFDWPRIAGRYLDLYRQIADRR